MNEAVPMFHIDATLLTDVAKYLSRQPYADVAELLNRLGTLKRVDVAATPATTGPQKVE